MAESQGPKAVGIAIAFAVVTLVVLILRLFARIFVPKKMGVDDCKFLLMICGPG
jgi:hypothetical protein